MAHFVFFLKACVNRCMYTPQKVDVSHDAFIVLGTKIEDILNHRGINTRVYFDIGRVTEALLLQIDQDDHDLSIILITEHNEVPVESSCPTILPYYDALRSRLNDMASRKKIVLISGIRNDELDGSSTPNIHRIWLPYSAMLYQHKAYDNIDIVRAKNFSSTKHWVSLNRCHNHHRLMMAMVLLGYDLGLSLDEKKDTGRLHISPAPLNKVNSWKEYYGTDIKVTVHQDNVLSRGFKKFKNGLNGGQPDGAALGLTFATLPENFDQRLRHLYADTVIEIVNGTTFYNPAGYNYCEKILNPILGLNLPLFACNVGTVQGMRLQGFDVFDDVLNHSYDTVSDPIERMFTLVESNLELLRNRDLARQCWVKCLPRLLKNVEVAREMLPRATESVLKDLDVYVQKTFNAQILVEALVDPGSRV